MTAPDFTQVDATNKALQADSKAAKTVKAAHGAVVDFLHAQYPVVVPPVDPSNGSVTGNWFRTDSPWRKVIPSNPVLDPNTLDMMKVVKAAHPSGLWVAGQQYGGSGSTPLWHANASTPTKGVLCHNTGKTVMIPWAVDANGKALWAPAPPADAHLAIVRDDTGDFWETQAFVIAADGSLSCHDIATGNLITGLGDSKLANSISVLPTLGGLVRPNEVAAGVIPHGFRIALSCVSSGVRYPATHSDGNTVGGPPAGATLWLPRSVPLPADPWLKMWAVAAQEHGCLIGDSSSKGAFGTLYVESSVDGSTYPFTLNAIPGTLLGAMVVLAA